MRSSGTVDRWGPAVVLALAVLLVVAVAPGMSDRPVSPQDEGLLLVYPDLLLDGSLPHRDFDSPYGPATVWVPAAAFAVAGPSVGAARAVGLLYLAVLAFGTYRLARPVTAPVTAAALGVSTLVLALPGGLAPLAWWGGVACLVLGAALMLDERRPRPAAGAALAGFALLFRPDLVVAVGGVVLACWLPADRPCRRRLALGLALGAGAPLALHLALVGPEAAVRWLTSGVRSAPGRRLPLPGPGREAGRLLGLTLLLVCGALVVTVVGVARRVGTARQGALAALVVGVLPQALQRADVTHVRGAAAVALPAAVLLLLPGLRARLRAVPHTDLALVAGVAGLAVLLAPRAVVEPLARAAGATAGVAAPEAAEVRRGEVAVPVARTRAGHLQALLDDLDTAVPPGGTLVVVPADMRRTNLDDTYIYFLARDLTPATYWLEMNPGGANRHLPELAADVERADVVITTSLYDRWDEPNASAERGSDVANRALRSSHCDRARHGPWTLWLKC